MTPNPISNDQLLSRDPSLSSENSLFDAASLSGSSNTRTNGSSSVRSMRTAGSRASARSFQNHEPISSDEKITRQLEIEWNEKLRRESEQRAYEASTGLCYDPRMGSHFALQETHPEDPARISSIYKEIVDAGLVNDPTYSGTSDPVNPGLMSRIEAREATEDEICKIHDRAQFYAARRLQGMDEHDLVELSCNEDSLYFNQHTFSCSKLSCGGAIETCLRVAQGHVRNAIAVVRPPGHHATPHKSMGFCIFNNVCIAARALQKRMPEMKKILIVDWDIHHGNGTQDAFYDDPSVLYISLHRYDGGRFYPVGPKGGARFCGTGLGTGFNVNIPWSEGGKLDGDYIYAFQKLVMPIALEYNPDFVIISAGFDAAAGDVLGECYITPAGFAHMAHMLMSLAKGKISVCLEGGYNLKSISNSALAVTKVLMGQPPDKLHDSMASSAAARVVEECMQVQAKYWRCLSSAVSLRPAKENIGLGLNVVVRAYQEKVFWEEYKMSPVSILHPTYQLFQNEVLMSQQSLELVIAKFGDVATSQVAVFVYRLLMDRRGNCHQATTVVMFVHDPPTVHGAVTNRDTKELDLHQALLIDPVHDYLKWAVQNGFGIIDVNIPQVGSAKNGTVYDPKRQSEALCEYLWDNYVELLGAKHIFLVGVEDAFNGILHLLTARDCREKVSGCINFICRTNMQSILFGGVGDSNIAEWYYENSLVFVGNTHGLWTSKKKLKARKKYGNCKAVEAEVVSEIMRICFDETTAFITERAYNDDNSNHDTNNGDSLPVQG